MIEYKVTSFREKRCYKSDQYVNKENEVNVEVKHDIEEACILCVKRHSVGNHHAYPKHVAEQPVVVVLS